MPEKEVTLNDILHAIHQLSGEVKGTNHRLDAHIKEMNEFKNEMSDFKNEMNGFKNETSSRFDKQDVILKDIHDTNEILVDENWRNKKDIHRIKNTMGMN